MKTCRLLLCILLTVALYSCGEKILSKQDSEVWKNDSVDCYCNREALAKKIFGIDQKIYKTFEKSEIEKTLGRPEHKEDNKYFYVIKCLKRTDGFCLEKSDSAAIFSSYLIIKFNNSKVDQITGICIE